MADLWVRLYQPVEQGKLSVLGRQRRSREKSSVIKNKKLIILHIGVLVCTFGCLCFYPQPSVETTCPKHSRRANIKYSRLSDCINALEPTGSRLWFRKDHIVSFLTNLFPSHPIPTSGEENRREVTFCFQVSLAATLALSGILYGTCCTDFYA